MSTQPILITEGPRGSEPGRSLVIDRFGPQRATAAGQLLAASHANYPAFRHLFPDAAVRQRVLLSFMTATAHDAATHGAALAAQVGEDVLGVALWMPPRTYPLSFGRKARMVPALLQVALAAGRAFPAFARLGSALERAFPGGQAWYLEAMGVHPSAQRHGIGGLLIAPALTWAADAGAPCHLHTSDPANVAYYRRFGFEVSQPAIQAFPGGPTYIGMTRPA